MAAKAKKTQTRPLFLSLLSTALLFLLLPAISAINQPDPSNTSNTDFIRTSCNVTLYHDLCFTSLSGYADSIKKSPANLARIAIEVSLARARRMATYLSKLLRQTKSDPGTTAALHDCSTTFDDAIDQMSSSIREMRRLNLTTGGKSFRFQISNVQTWMSASLTNEDTCTDGFDDLPDGPIKSDVSDRVGNVSKFASIALALVNSFAAKVVNEE